MARAITSDELTKLRSANQWSRLYLAVLKPATVYSARVNQTSFGEMVSQVTYDGGSGTLADVLAGMTLLVGSATGGHDLGMARIRKAPTATVLYIGATSEVAWADDAYLTVVDDLALWGKPIVQDSEGNVLIDTDNAYSDQHDDTDPTPVLGPTCAALWLTGATVTFSPDASASWCADGSAISSYSWSAPGASATANLTTATPTITYNAAGTYRVSCTITAANSKSFTGHRVVFVYTEAVPPTTQFNVSGSPYGEVSEGGWKFAIELYDQALLSDIRERALVCLFSKDYYGGTFGSIGPLSGYENLIAAGWIEGESIRANPKEPAVQFSARGPAWWLKQIPGEMIGLTDSGATPENWTEIDGLTVDKTAWHILHWRSTATRVMDVTLSGDTRTADYMDLPGGSLWDQLQYAAERILARPLCDRFGRLFVEIEPSCLASDQRSSVPTVMEITSADRGVEMEIERRPVNRTASMDINNGDNIYSRAPGSVGKRYGTAQSRDGLLFGNQDQANLMSGMLLAEANNEFPYVPVALTHNNRMIDITPRQRVTLSLAAGDSPRGLVWSSKALIPTRVAYKIGEQGQIETDLDCEAETSGPPGITIAPPQPPVTNIMPIPPIEIPTWPIIPPGGGSGYVPPVVPPPLTGNDCATNLAEPPNGPVNTWFNGTSLPTDQWPLTQWFKFWARGADATYPTRYTLNGTMYARDGSWNWVPVYTADTDNWWNLYLVDSSRNVIATAVKDAYDGGYQRTGTFNLANGANIDGIELVMTRDGTNVWNQANTFDEGFGYGYILTPGAQSTGATVYSAYARLIGSVGRIVNYYGQSSESGHAFTFTRASGAPPLHTLVVAKATWQSQHMGLEPYIWMNGPYSTDWQQFDGDSVTAYYTQTYGAADYIRVGYHNRWPARDQDYNVTVNFEVTLYPQPSRKFVVNGLMLWNICDYVEGA